MEKWPFKKEEFHIYLAYFNALTQKGQYAKIVPILDKLLVNLGREYQDVDTFENFYTCLIYKLMRALRETGQCKDILQVAEKGLRICKMVGDISNTYGIQSELLCYFEQNDFFHDAKI